MNGEKHAEGMVSLCAAVPSHGTKHGIDRGAVSFEVGKRRTSSGWTLPFQERIRLETVQSQRSTQFSVGKSSVVEKPERKCLLCQQVHLGLSLTHGLLQFGRQIDVQL